MDPRCTVCNHPLIDDINRAVLSGDYSLNQLSDKFGPSRGAFHRHKGHLEKKIRRTVGRLEDHRQQVALLKLDAFLGQVEKRLEASAAAEDTDRVYKGAQIGSRIINQMTKMDLPLELETAYLLFSAPGPVSLDSLLPAGPQVIPSLHRALLDQALAPCPPPAEDELDDAAADPPADLPDPEKDLRRLLAPLDSKQQRRQTAKAGRQERKKLRWHKHSLQEKNLVQNFVPGPADDDLPSPPDPIAPPETRNPEPETPTDHWPPTTGHCTSDHCTSDPDPQPERHKSATDAKRRRRQIRKMERYQKYIFKAKKLLKKFSLGHDRTDEGRKNEAPPAAPRTTAPLETRNLEPDINPDPCPFETENRKLKTENPLVYDPWSSPDLDPWLSPFLPGAEPPPDDSLETPNPFPQTQNPEPETPDPAPCLSETKNQKPKTENRLLDPEIRNSKPKPPPPYDETARRADELFEISHGYKRNNPPKHIPNRHWDEDLRSGSIFGNLKAF